jgi:hypothetical protein
MKLRLPGDDTQQVQEVLVHTLLLTNIQKGTKKLQDPAVRQVATGISRPTSVLIGADYTHIALR